MSTPSTKCPKCGSSHESNGYQCSQFKCGTIVMADGLTEQSELCAARTALEKAKDALKPFGKWGAYIGDGGYFSGDLVFMTATSDGELKVTLGDLRRASAVLKEIE